MGLPVLNNIAGIVKTHNENAKKIQEYKMKEETVRKAHKALARHKGPEQIARQNWAKKHGDHDYGNRSTSTQKTFKQ